ncbi:sialic acid-binding Ig-like lectin 10 [Sceloporus undulatus]|uniref:sialic acid-binding Ig-like lectin 10 n=1 Tax=Sceloporus undulatus TaxID=8520 RepID=UPI001C4D079E|nr:sialic acid-binding Ig-like lectin 10 [Sceloporus undulatus]
MGYSLKVLVLGLLSTCLQGVQCDPLKYKMNAPTAVTVPEGLCVIIPCNFTYDPDDASSTSTLYGYWYKEESSDKLPAVATNDGTKSIEDYAQNRFTLSDEVAHGNSLHQRSQKSDGQKYYFRMEKERSAKFSYKTVQPSVNVINLENPEIIFWGDLQAGQPVNITCTAPGSCSLKPPHIFWKFTPRKSTPRSSEMQSNGSQVYISMLDFMPSKTDNGKELTCSVTYGGGASPVSKERTVLLNIRYAPLIQQIQVTHGNDSVKNYTAPSQIVVEKGDSVVLRCMAEGNPPANVTWAKESANLTTDKVLKLSSVKMQDVGEYKCHAQNSEGSDTMSFQLSIAYRPRPCKQKRPHCWRDDSGFQCNCSICSSPMPRIQWLVDGETLEGNTTKGYKQVTTWIEMDVGTSTLRLTGNWDGDHHLVCSGTNAKGEYPIMFFLFSSAESNWSQSTINAVVAVLAVFAIVVLIVAIVLISKKCQRKSMTDLESHKKLRTPHSEISPSGQGFNTIDLNKEAGNYVPKEPEKAEESADIVSNDPEELHYASITFSVPNQMPEPTSEEPQTEYAEIKR